MLLSNQLPQIKVSFHPKQPVSQRLKVASSRDVYELVLTLWNHDTIYLFEEFLCLYLDRKNSVIGYRFMCRGSSTGTVVDLRLILALALNVSACGIILAHNHPSGNLKPSNEDLRITKKIQESSIVMDIKLLDHLIISTESYYSFSDEGNL